MATSSQMPTTDEREGAFRTHAGYLRAINDLALGAGFTTTNKKLGQLAKRADNVLPSPVRTARMTEELKGCLHRAWGTELILATTQDIAADPDVIRLANSWGSVQTYYVFYGAVQALLLADGQARPTQHEPTKKQYVSQWVTRSFHLPPWTVGLGPVVRAADSRGFRGVTPELIVPGQAHAWSYSWSGDDAYHVLGQALKGTRKDKVQDAVITARERKAAAEKRAWLDEEAQRVAAGRRPRKQPSWPSRRNLTAGERTQVENSTRLVTLMDYMYRLRIKANYEDATMFTDGPDTDATAASFLTDLHALAASTLLVHELRISRLLPAGALEAEMDRWLRRNANGTSNSRLPTRLGLIQQLG